MSSTSMLTFDNTQTGGDVTSNNVVVRFAKHVFNFDTESKNEMMNLCQYILLALLPLSLLTKCLERYIPPANEDNSSLQLGLEIALQMIVLFLGMLFIHRAICFVPTYSGERYANVNIIGSVLIGILLILTIQSKFTDKVLLLHERAMDAWAGTNNAGNKKKRRPATGSDMTHGGTTAINTDMSAQLASITPSVSTAPINSNNTVSQPTPLSALVQPSQIQQNGALDVWEPIAANAATCTAFGNSVSW